MTALADIQKQIAELQKQAEQIVNNEKSTVIAELKEKITAYNITAEELGFSIKTQRGKKATKTTLPAKYRNDATGDTWHGGRGAKPKWVKEIEANGGNIDDYLIKIES